MITVIISFSQSKNDIIDWVNTNYSDDYNVRGRFRISEYYTYSTAYINIDTNCNCMIITELEWKRKLRDVVYYTREFSFNFKDILHFSLVKDNTDDRAFKMKGNKIQVITTYTDATIKPSSIDFNVPQVEPFEDQMMYIPPTSGVSNDNLLRSFNDLIKLCGGISNPYR